MEFRLGDSKGNQTLSDTRDKFLNEIRKEERNAIISRKQFFSSTFPPSQDKEDDTFRHLEYLDTYGDLALKLKSEVKEAFKYAPKETEIPVLIQDMMNGDIISKHTAIVKLRKCLSVQIDSPIQTVLDHNALPYLVDLIKKDEHPYLQLEATWCVTNMATGSSFQISRLVEKGVIPLFIQLLSKNNLGLVEQAVWGVGNIAGDVPQYRDMLVNNNCMVSLRELYEKVKSVNGGLRDQIIWAASNLCRQKPLPIIEKVLPGFPMFCEALRSSSKTSLLMDCLWGLMPMCNPNTLGSFRDIGILPRIVELLESDHASIIHPALKIVGTFTNSQGDFFDVLSILLDNRVSECRRPLLQATELPRSIHKEDDSDLSFEHNCRGSKPY